MFFDIRKLSIFYRNSTLNVRVLGKYMQKGRCSLGKNIPL